MIKFKHFLDAFVHVFMYLHEIKKFLEAPDGANVIVSWGYS